ncbi:carboxylesterase family protein [Saccharothrix texasensis]|uniref:carboxylesterase family protein n=1 Tax=Saccharothrix texasensis TaxID=103734 RepID=UPI003CCC4F29
MVTCDYRLGFAGCFGHVDGQPDNRGPLDRPAVLRWVREHIGVFGGDPGAITAAGQSAGAGSSRTACPTGSTRRGSPAGSRSGSTPARRSRRSRRPTPWPPRGARGRRATTRCCSGRSPTRCPRCPPGPTPCCSTRTSSTRCSTPWAWVDFRTTGDPGWTGVRHRGDEVGARREPQRGVDHPVRPPA